MEDVRNKDKNNGDDKSEVLSEINSEDDTYRRFRKNIKKSPRPFVDSTDKTFFGIKAIKSF